MGGHYEWVVDFQGALDLVIMVAVYPSFPIARRERLATWVQSYLNSVALR